MTHNRGIARTGDKIMTENEQEIETACVICKDDYGDMSDCLIQGVCPDCMDSYTADELVDMATFE